MVDFHFFDTCTLCQPVFESLSAYTDCEQGNGNVYCIRVVVVFDYAPETLDKFAVSKERDLTLEWRNVPAMR